MQNRRKGTHMATGRLQSEGKTATKQKVLLYAVIILAIGVALRLLPLHYQGFYEPDGFYHYSVIRAAISNGYVIPRYLGLSGFPAHTEVSEPLGLYYLTMAPYYLFNSIGVNYYTIMRLLPVLFGILDVIGAYFLAKLLVKDYRIGIISMVFVAISAANAARTYATIYRGDTFVTIFLIAAILLAARGIMGADESRIKGWLFPAASATVLGSAFSIWQGTPFAVVVYALGTAFLIAYGFIKEDIGVARGAFRLSICMIIPYLLEVLFLSTGVMVSWQPLTGINFFAIYVPMLVVATASLLGVSYLKRPRRQRHGNYLTGALRTTRARAIVSALVAIAAISAIVLLLGSRLYYLAIGGGLLSAQTALERSIQELQKPGPLFLFSSFSFQLLLAPIGVALYLFGMKGRKGIKALRGTMPSFLLLLSYLLVTLYLQVNASRFNSLLSIPMAGLSAYAVWAIASDKSKSTIRIFNDRVNMRATLVGLLAAFIIIEFVVTAAQSAAFSQADGIDPAFLSAMAWMRNSTPANATVLAFWPDGSVIEGWADRTSFMDSVGGQNSALIANFSDFILNSSPDPQYLYDIGRPQYLVVRYLLLDESLPIVEEGNLSASRYYYIQLQPAGESKSQGSSTYGFMAPRGYPYYTVSVTIPNGSLSLPGATLLSTNGTAYNATIIYYNMSSGTYGISDAVGAPSSLPTVLVYLNSTGTVASAALTSSGLADSNLFKLLIECGQASCAYNPGNVSLSIVYSNNDTKIFRLSYR